MMPIHVAADIRRMEEEEFKVRTYEAIPDGRRARILTR
jgi:hypothetical protein